MSKHKDDDRQRFHISREDAVVYRVAMLVASLALCLTKTPGISHLGFLLFALAMGWGLAENGTLGGEDTLDKGINRFNIGFWGIVIALIVFGVVQDALSRLF